MRIGSPSAALQDFFTFIRGGWGGRIPLSQQVGTFAAPLASFTGAASGLIAIPTPIKIPGGLINPNSTLVVEATVKRVGVNGTANLDVRLGSANAIGDPAILTLAQAATTNLVSSVVAKARFGALATTLYAQGLVLNNQAGAALGADVTTNIDTSVDMYVNIGVSSANAADSFGLLSITAWIEQ